MEDTTFELTDSQGETHDYRVSPHPSREGSTLMLQIGSLLSEPLLEAIRALVSRTERNQGLMDAEIEDLVGQLDLSKIGGSLRSSLAELDADTLHSFFRHTTRDGKDLGNGSIYDAAYKGNWGEWVRALWQIIQANGFIAFLPTTPTS